MHDFTLLAYFDPGAGSILLQAMAGGAAGIFVLVKWLWQSAFLRAPSKTDAGAAMVHLPRDMEPVSLDA